MYKKRAILTFWPETVKQPITYQLIKQFDIIINILQARVFPEEEGQLIIEMQNDQEQHITEALEYLESVGVQTKVLEETIAFEQDLCISCGACTGVCKPRALTLDRASWDLDVDQDKCLLCGLCVAVCPMKALSLPNG